jgi:hypothetical protein
MNGESENMLRESNGRMEEVERCASSTRAELGNRPCAVSFRVDSSDSQS